MIESIIDTQGRTTLPKAVREALSVQPGNRVRYFIHQDDQVQIMAVRPIERLFGILQYPGGVTTAVEGSLTLREDGRKCDGQ